MGKSLSKNLICLLALGDFCRKGSGSLFHYFFQIFVQPSQFIVCLNQFNVFFWTAVSYVERRRSRICRRSELIKYFLPAKKISMSTSALTLFRSSLLIRMCWMWERIYLPLLRFLTKMFALYS